MGEPSLGFRLLEYPRALVLELPEVVVMTLLIVGSLPMIESLFHITTRVRWLEMADLNHPLLKRMTLEAPGTFDINRSLVIEQNHCLLRHDHRFDFGHGLNRRGREHLQL